MLKHLKCLLKVIGWFVVILPLLLVITCGIIPSLVLGLIIEHSGCGRDGMDLYDFLDGLGQSLARWYRDL